jgi:hypothetical protein
MEAEDLALFLAVGTDTDFPRTKLELLEAWRRKSDSVKVAYLLRAKRLLKAMQR